MPRAKFRTNDLPHSLHVSPGRSPITTLSSGGVAEGAEGAEVIGARVRGVPEFRNTLRSRTCMFLRDLSELHPLSHWR